LMPTHGVLDFADHDGIRAVRPIPTRMGRGLS
jgi:hypothetical protein